MQKRKLSKDQQGKNVQLLATGKRLLLSNWSFAEVLTSHLTTGQYIGITCLVHLTGVDLMALQSIHELRELKSLVGQEHTLLEVQA